MFRDIPIYHRPNLCRRLFPYLVTSTSTSNQTPPQAVVIAVPEVPAAMYLAAKKKAPRDSGVCAPRREALGSLCLSLGISSRDCWTCSTRGAVVVVYPDGEVLGLYIYTHVYISIYLCMNFEFLSSPLLAVVYIILLLSYYYYRTNTLSC